MKVIKGVRVLLIIMIVGTEEDVNITVIISITDNAHAPVGPDIDYPVHAVMTLTNVQTDLIDVTRSVVIQHQATNVSVAEDMLLMVVTIVMI